MNLPLLSNCSAILLLALGLVAQPVSGSESARNERSARAGAPEVSFWNFDPCQGLIASPAQRTRVVRASAAVPQLPAVNDQPKLNPIYAPGTDPAKYVPGSTAQPFGQFDSFSLGKILFRPSARILYQYDSNLLNVPGVSTTANHSFQFEPSIEAFIPVTGNGIRVEYVAAYRKYSSFDLSRSLTHVINADSQINITPLLSLGVREHFALSSLDTREFVPGREIIFSDAPFRRNDVGAQLSWTITDRNTVGLDGDLNKISFDGGQLSAPAGTTFGNPADSIPFYDYDQYKYGGFYRRSVSQRTGLIFNGAYFRNLTKDPRDIANSRGFEALVGIETDLTPLTSGQFSVGFRGESFPGAPGQDFRGTVFRGVLQKEFTESIRIELSASRSTNPSYFQGNAYYVSTGVGLTYTQEVGPKLFLSVAPGYLSNSYPTPLTNGADVPSTLVGAENRADRLFELSVDARYRFTDWVALEFFCDLIHRDSALFAYRFTNYSAGGGILIGLHGANRGRFPY
ncbi:MAG TPA: outer membrane beta-barrel protein [Acidobacteriota bacterium]|nr:outer membrane beta-barrel protein [Acidobacteriota bacterium]